MAVRIQLLVSLLVFLFTLGCNESPTEVRRFDHPDDGSDSGSSAQGTLDDDDAGDVGRLDAVDDGGAERDVRSDRRADVGGDAESGEVDAGADDDLDIRDTGADSGTPDEIDAGGDSGTRDEIDAGGDNGTRDELDSGGDNGGGDVLDGGGGPDTGTSADAGGSSRADASDAGDAGDADAGAQDPACLEVDPYPSTLINPAGLANTQGQFQFVARDGNTLTAYTHRSPQFDPATGQIVFIMHGVNRNADDYLDVWRSEVNGHNVLAIAPEFPKSHYPGSEDYQLGVGTSGTPYTGTYNPNDWRNPDDYTHSEIEHLFEAVRTELGNASCRYSIYGHSAGSQFVHRLLTFRPDARVAKAVAANAGWYTMASDGGGSDPNFYMPYGVQGAPPNSTRLERLFAHELVVLLGGDDINRGSYLRTTSEADAQGLNRLQRGQFYYTTAQQDALAAGLPFHWTLDIVPNVGHSNSGMTPAAATHLFGP